MSVRLCKFFAKMINNKPSGQVATAAEGVSAANAALVPGAKQRQQAVNSTGRKIYKVRLWQDEHKHLKKILDSGIDPKERRRRAHILLLADESRSDGALNDAEVAEVLKIGIATLT